MEIIKAEIEHLDSVYHLICELENEHLDFELFKQIYLKNICDENIYYLLSAEGSDVIGFASLHMQNLLHHCAKICEIQELVVVKQHQHKGIGKALFNRLHEIAIKQNCSQLEVCCNKKREGSRLFYERLGMLNSHYKFTLTLD